MKIAIRILHENSGRYRAWCPCLPGCVSFGASEEEVRERIEQAVRGYLASFDAEHSCQCEMQLVES